MPCCCCCCWEGGGLTFLGVQRLLVSVGCVGALENDTLVTNIQTFQVMMTKGTHNHLLVSRHLHALALHHLDILQPAQHLVLDLEGGRHSELGALLDAEGLVLEGLFGARHRQINRHGRSTRGVHRQTVNDADAGIRGVGEVLAAREAEGFLVSLEGLIVCVCEGGLASFFFASVFLNYLFFFDWERI